MNALLIINSKNNNFAVLYKDIENILEKFGNFSNQEAIFTYFEEIKKISFATLDENKQIKDSDDFVNPYKK